MKPHPRIRKTVKWGGLVLAILLAGLRIATAWRPVLWTSPGGVQLSVARGWMDAVWLAPGVRWDGADYVIDGPAVLIGARPMGPLDWAVDYRRDSIGTHAGLAILVPFWLTVYITGFAWYVDLSIRRRTALLGRCPSCRYDRTGLAPSAVCPECGAAAPAPPAAQ